MTDGPQGTFSPLGLNSSLACYGRRCRMKAAPPSRYVDLDQEAPGEGQIGPPELNRPEVRFRPQADLAAGDGNVRFRAQSRPGVGLGSMSAPDPKRTMRLNSFYLVWRVEVERCGRGRPHPANSG